MENDQTQRVDINAEMQAAYLSYAMSVIVARALPDARDGLKPVHRRILYAMHDMGIGPGTAHKKSARIVGEVLGKYHPHGDQAVYDAMARMAQDFSMRSELVDGQGNFGSVDGDTPAAMRYTEARLHSISTQLLADIQKNTVDFAPNFDDTLQEPTVLPAAFPNLLVNGGTGIAVGMSTSIPPHNLGEICAALELMLQHWNELDDVQVDDLMRFVKGPDFPTGGLIVTPEDEDPLAAAYGSGRGKIKVHARIHVEELTRGRSRIIVTELPYQTNKATLISRIATLARANRITGLSDLRDESDRQGMRIVIDLTKSAQPDEVVRNLFRLTPLQSTFSIILLALVNGEPRMLTLKQALRVFLQHRLDVVRRRSQFDLSQAKERAHILEGMLTALAELDVVIGVIRKSADTPAARGALMKRFKLSEKQANAILEMPLRRLARLEQQKLKDEYKALQNTIKNLQALLRSPQKMRAAVADELQAVSDKYADPRRTHIMRAGDGPAETSAGGLAPDQDCWLVLTDSGKLARIDSTRRPGLSDYTPLALLRANTHDVLFLLTSEGTAAALAVHAIPIAAGPLAGAALHSVSALTERDEVVAAVTLPHSVDSESADALCLFLTTRNGVVKRLRAEQLPGPSARTFRVMKVEAADRVISSCWISANEDAMLFTAEGQGIRFRSSAVRTTGLAAGGVQGIRMGSTDDFVIGCAAARPGSDAWTIARSGEAKRTALTQYPLQGRNGKGVQAWKLSGGQRLAAALVPHPDDDLAVVTSTGKARALKAGAAPRRGRPSGGAQAAELEAGESVERVVAFQPRLTERPEAPEEQPKPLRTEPAASAKPKPKRKLKPKDGGGAAKKRAGSKTSKKNNEPILTGKQPPKKAAAKTGTEVSAAEQLLMFKAPTKKRAGKKK